MKKEYTVEELVILIDEKLKDHDITFEEYLLLKEIRNYERHDEKIMKSLEDKGYVKNNKITDHNKLNDVQEALHIFFSTKKDDTDAYLDNKLLLQLTLSELYKLYKW